MPIFSAVPGRSSRYRLLLLLACFGAFALLTPMAGARQNASSWAKSEIRTVVSHGLMAPTVGSFRPNDPLIWQEYEELLVALPVEPFDSWSSDTGTGDTTTDPTDTTGTTTDPTDTTDTTDTTGTGDTTTDPTGTTGTTGTTTTPSDDPLIPDTVQASDPVTLAQFDTAIVKQLGLTETADRFRDSVRTAGLKPPKRFGTEAVARLLGLRINHPARQDKLELLPNQPITRAEVAYSVARALEFRGDELQWVDQLSYEFTPPDLSRWQKRVLNYAISFVGYPYIWGGTSPKKQSLWGKKLPGGFDCSGFVWRVYKLRSYNGGKRLSRVLRGRTTYVMSGEVKRSKRISFANLQPGDVIFFGQYGPRSKPTQVGHMGIYIGDNWFVQSSGKGVDVAPLEGWYKSRFAWGRRPLAEAGLG